MPGEGPSACQKWVGGLCQLRGGDQGFSRCRGWPRDRRSCGVSPPPSHPKTEPTQRAGFEAALLEAERAWALCWAGCSSGAAGPLSAAAPGRQALNSGAGMGDGTTRIRGGPDVPGSHRGADIPQRGKGRRRREGAEPRSRAVEGWASCCALRVTLWPGLGAHEVPRGCVRAPRTAGLGVLGRLCAHACSLLLEGRPAASFRGSRDGAQGHTVLGTAESSRAP